MHSAPELDNPQMMAQGEKLALCGRAARMPIHAAREVLAAARLSWTPTS